MKKIAAILFAFIVLLSGINLSIASHLCDGKLVDIRISLDKEKSLSCKMNLKTSTLPNSFSRKNCCSNELKVISTDKNYTTPSSHIDFSQKILWLFILPSLYVIQKTDGKKQGFHCAVPPDEFLLNKVELEDICVFII